VAEPETKKKKLPIVTTGEKPAEKKAGGKAAKTKAGGWAAFTDAGTAPKYVIAARVIMVLSLLATIPVILGLHDHPTFTGNRLLWTVLVASLPFFWMTFGFHLWRRICPLAVMGQIGRLVGKPGTRKLGDWMGKNYFLVQFALMLVGLTLRLVATNGSPWWLAGFLALVVVAAIVVSFVYGGKTWCNFICPVGMVEKIHTEPSAAAIGSYDMNSQCAPCVACKKHCPDIDLEQGYWKEAADKPRRIAYFAWPGVVVAFYAYYYLVRDWDYYFSGSWTREIDLPSQMFAPGFWFAPAVPRIVAAPLTLIVFGAVSYALFALVEHVIKSQRLRRLGADATEDQKTALATRVRHGMLAFCGLVAFNAFYQFAGQPTLQHIAPDWIVKGWALLVVFASTAMFVRRIVRTEDQYVTEKFAQKILKKWEWGDAPPSDDLKDIYLLHTERTKQRESRLRAYKETVREMVADGLVTRNELVILDSLRAQLGISDKDHAKVVGELSAEERQLFDPKYQGSVESRLAREQYRKDLERIVVDAARQGNSPTESMLDQLRSERGVNEDEASAELAAILAPGGPIAAIFDAEVSELVKHVAVAEATNHAPRGDGDASSRGLVNDSASLSLLRHLARRRAHDHAVQALGVLTVMTQRPEVEQVRAQAAAQRRLIRLQTLDMLSGVDPALRVPLVEAVTRLARGEKTELTAPPILAVSNDNSRYVRAASAILLSRFDDDASRERLLLLLEDSEVIVREAAVRAMGAKSRLTRDLLTKILNDPEPLVRQAAVRAVSGGTSSELPAIDPAMLAQTTKGVGQAGVYATLDSNAAMASLTVIEKMMLIRQVPIFHELGPDDLEELATVVEEFRLEQGKDLFREGDPGDAVYLIVKGTVRVFTGGPEGGGNRPERLLNELGSGQCIGEMAVLDSAPRSATVRALERTRVLRVPGEGFKRVMSERPEMSEAIVAELVRRMRGMMQAGTPAGTPQLSSAAIIIPKQEQ